MTTKLDGLLCDAVSALPHHLLQEVVAFGSAPLVLAGLKPDANDLDLFVSNDTFDALVAAGFSSEEQTAGVHCIHLAQGVDVFKTWQGVEFTDVFRASSLSDSSHGVRVANLRHVLAAKLASNRPKDQPDIAVLRQALKA